MNYFLVLGYICFILIFYVGSCNTAEQIISNPKKYLLRPSKLKLITTLIVSSLLALAIWGVQ
jgi:hypothetical protein